MYTTPSDCWAIILGGSSGIGLASARRLAKMGYNICIVHRDRKGAMDRIDPLFDEIKGVAHRFVSYNGDALSQQSIKQVLDRLSTEKALGKVRVLLHSIAYGSLKNIVPNVTDPFLYEEEVLSTVQAMGTSLLTWTQALFAEKFFSSDARVLGLTSEGNEVAWKGYAAVSAAKGALEAIARSIAREFAPFGIRCNIIQPGITDTPALRMIPEHDKLIAHAIERNPFGRLTTVEEVADVVGLLTLDAAQWINGEIIRVDGGERIGGR